MQRADSDTIATQERLAEIGEIIAAGLKRLQALKSSGLSGENGENSLPYDASQSGHAAALSPEASR
jgi:hypothetical protein